MSKILIEVKNLSKTFGKNDSLTHALKGVDLEIHQGDFIAITGPSGCGKTTLLNIMAGLIQADTGSVLFQGRDILAFNNADLSAYRNQSVGYILQNFGLINSLNVLKNVLLPVKKHKKRFQQQAENNLTLLGIEAKKKAFPYELSGGQKQRVAIARALINDPDIILADEPTGSLDAENSQKIIDALKELNAQGKTIVMVTHEASIAQQCHKIVKLLDGEVV